MRFNRIAPADEGRYVCTASNMYGNTTKVAEVIVNSKLKIPEIFLIVIIFLLDNTPVDEPPHGFGRVKEAYEGDTVSLTCSDGNPRGRFSRVI